MSSVSDGVSVIIPLAGPDCYLLDGRIRPLISSEARGNLPLDELPCGTPLIAHVLQNRFWRSLPHQLIFVIRHQPPASETLRRYLIEHFPGCAVNTVANVTRGAVFSVQAGLAQIAEPAWPVVFDLADIAFDWSFDVLEYFQSNAQTQAVIPWFTSEHPKFSYLRCDGQRVLEAREKVVISNRASAGVYIVRNMTMALVMLSHGLHHPEQVTVKDSYFLCPCMNGLISIGNGVDALPVHSVQPFSLYF